jgi:hypothetical protein
MNEISKVQTPHCKDHFSGAIHLDQKSGAKRDIGMFQSTWQYCIRGNDHLIEFHLTESVDRKFLLI